MTASSMSKGFFEFVKSIGEAKSKQEEDGIIENEIHILKAKMGARNVAPRQMREYLIRMVYVEMLGHDASFGHIHAVKLTRASKLVDKRVGYMACSLCLHKDHELMLLLVGGLQTDLQSQNQLEVATALILSCKLINEDTIPAVLPLVDKLLNHSEATIRKKAIMVIQRFNELSKQSVTNVCDKAKRMLCDTDPSVMGASLYLLSDLVEENASDYTELVSSFVSILKQIIEHRLAKDYDYHRMPAPWTQIKLLQILAHLGCANKTVSEGMYEVLHEVMRRADIGINVGYAIIYECVRTVTTIYPNTQLLAEAAKCTSRFITSENHNLKYLGINALASIVQINPSAANEHQMVVIDCLEDKDETLRRKTLDLLYKMTNENNVNVICTKLINSLKDSVDSYLRTQLAEKITFLAEKFAPDTIWYIETMSDVFELGAELVSPQFAHNFIKTLAEGIVENQEDEEAEEDIANYAADFFYQILVTNLNKKRKRIPNILLRIVAWVMGEYGQFCTGKPVNDEEEEEKDDDEDEIVALSPMEVIRTLWSVIEKQGEDLSTRQWAMSATCKLCRHLDEIPAEIEHIVAKYRQSTQSDLVQISHEFVELCKERQLQTYVFDHACIVDDIKVDDRLKFLDGVVQSQMKQGKREYAPPDDDSESVDEPKEHGLVFNHHSKLKDLESTLVLRSDGVGDVGAMGALGSGADDEEQEEVAAPAPDEPVALNSRIGRGGFGGRPSKQVWGPHVEEDDERGAEAMNSAETKYKTTVISVAAYDAAPASSSAEQRRSSVPVPVKQGRERERAMSEKERQAQLLFTGDSGANKPRRKIRTKKRIATTKPKSAAVAKPASAAQAKKPAAVQDMMGGMDSAASAPKQAKAAAATKAPSNPVDDLLNFGAASNAANSPEVASSGDLGLFDDLLGAPASTSQAQSASSGALNQSSQMAPQSGGGLLDDLFGGALGGDNSGINQSQNQNQNQNNANVGGDIFGSLGGSNAQANNSGNLLGGNRGFAALKSQLSAQVLAFPRSHDLDQMLFENSQLSISYFKIFKQQKSTLCAFISNLSGAAMSNIQVAIKGDGATQLQFGFDVSSSIPKPQLRNAHTAVINSLPSGSTACQMITFGLNNFTQIQIPCNMALSIGTETVNIGLQISDLLRPTMIGTNDFGLNWSKLGNGSFAVTVNTANAATNHYIERLTKKLHLHHIQTIQMETIAAGNLSSITNASMILPILVHCKTVQSQSYSVIIRTPNVSVSKMIGTELQQLLQS